MIRIHLPHTMEVSLHAHEVDVVILITETVGWLGVNVVPYYFGRVFQPNRSHACCLVRATKDSQTCQRYFLASITGSSKENKGLMVFRVRPIPTRFPTNILNTPVSKSVTPEGVRRWVEGAYFPDLTWSDWLISLGRQVFFLLISQTCMTLNTNLSPFS